MMAATMGAGAGGSAVPTVAAGEGMTIDAGGGKSGAEGATVTIGRASGKPTTLVSAKAATTMMSKRLMYQSRAMRCVTKDGAMVSVVLRRFDDMWH